MAKTAVIYGGFPLSGKDTQTKPLKKLGELVFETGPELKRIAKQNPNDPTYAPILKGDLVEDGVTLWVTKLWIMDQIKTHPKHQRIHLNGVPRRKEQFAIVEWLRERGYHVVFVWFTTPPDVCETRAREDRFEDNDPDIRANRRRIHENETMPMFQQVLPKHGISEEHGNLLCIDNTHLTREQTAQLIIDFIRLPFTPAMMFPHESANNHHSTARPSNGAGDMQPAYA